MGLFLLRPAPKPVKMSKRYRLSDKALSARSINPLQEIHIQWFLSQSSQARLGLRSRQQCTIKSGTASDYSGVAEKEEEVLLVIL